MCAEEKKEQKKEKAGCADFGCKPGEMKEMFQKMSACCPGMAGAPDFTAMMKVMKGRCCGPETKSEAGEQKETASCS